VKIHILRERATAEQVADMLEALDTYIKLAVDIEHHVVAGGGAMHYDCEQVLLEDGSRQEDVWGADWDPQAKQVRFEALINIRPRQNNRSMHIQDTEIKKRVDALVRQFFEDVK
jgi:hypothetical protein